MSFAIRPMAPGDLDAVLAIAAASPEAPGWARGSFGPYLAPDQQPPHLRIAFVADSAGEILAFAAASLLLLSEPSVCDLESISVHPAARRQGIGSALLRSVLAWALDHGAQRLCLEVRAGNASALRLYERLGMQVEGRRPRYYTAPEEDALLLGIPITPVRKPARFPPGK